MRRRETVVQATRDLLWAHREEFLPHMLEHRCEVTARVGDLCGVAGWTWESYLLACLFDREELIVEGTK